MNLSRVLLQSLQQSIILLLIVNNTSNGRKHWYKPNHVGAGFAMNIYILVQGSFVYLVIFVSLFVSAGVAISPVEFQKKRLTGKNYDLWKKAPRA